MNQKPNKPDDPLALVKHLADVLKRHRHTIYLASLLLAVAGVIGVSLIPSQYKATTTILVDPQKIPERYVASTITSDPNAHLSTLTQQVLSASRLQEIINQVNLYPNLRAKKSREELVEYMRSKIKIELKQGSEQGLSSFTISYIDQNRWQVAQVANQLASSFIDWNLKSRQQQALLTTQFLSSELDQAQKGLQEQEAALQSFRMQHVGATPDQLNANLQALSRLQSDVESNNDAIGRLDEERILLTQPRPEVARDPSTLGERGKLVQERTRLENELSNLRRQYTDTYPDVISTKAQLETVKTRLAALPEPKAGSLDNYDPTTQMRLSLINKEIDRRKEQLAVLQRQIGSYQGKVQSVPILETQLAELTRNYETSRQNYQSLLDKRLSAGMSEDLERKQQAERFTVLDLAGTPEKPFEPKRLPLMAGAVLLAVLLSSGTVVGINFLKGGVRSEADLASVLGPKLRILGTVPPIVTKGDERHSRIAALQLAAVSLLACAALVAYFLKVRPML